MELIRKKNTDTRILFPIVDADGDFVTGAASLDSEWISYDTADHGGAAPSFADCTHEATEIGTSGIYYLDVSAAEINKNFTLIQIKTSTTGAKTQAILISTYHNDDMVDLHTDVADVHTDLATVAGYIDTEVGDIHTDVADLHTDVGTVLTNLSDLHTDVGTAITNIGDVHATDLPAIKTIIDDLHNTDVPAIKTVVDAIPTATQNADALLNRDMSAVSDTNARSPLNALRFLRNKWVITEDTLSVKKENDTTEAWNSTVTGTVGAEPITGNDPS